MKTDLRINATTANMTQCKQCLIDNIKLWQKK